MAAQIYLGGAAFEHKDYDRFLELSKSALKMSPQDPRLLATVASGLACKYATTGLPEYRTQAEQALAQAREQSLSAEEKANYEEYAERIVYRLNSREIIDKDVYDRRFRQKKGQP